MSKQNRSKPNPQSEPSAAAPVPVPHSSQLKPPRSDGPVACTVCREEYTATPSSRHVPRLLPCAHSLCAECVDHIARADVANTNTNAGISNDLTCPFCRQVCPKSDVRTNDALISVIPRASKEATAISVSCCDHCEDGQGRAAVLRCTACNANFCQPCYDSIHGSKVMKAHAHVALSEVSLVTCATHSRSLELYCHTCSRAICVNCLTSVCKDHKFAEPAEVSEAATQQMEASAKKLGECRTGLTNRVEQCEQAKQANAKAKATAMTAVRTAMAQLADSVAMLGAVLEHQVAAVFDASVKQMDLHKEQLETMMEGVRSMLLSCENLTKKWTTRRGVMAHASVVGWYVERASVIGVHGESMWSQCDALCKVDVQTLLPLTPPVEATNSHVWDEAGQHSLQKLQLSVDKFIAHADTLHSTFMESTSIAPVQKLLTTPLPCPLPADFITGKLPYLMTHWIHTTATPMPRPVKLQLLYQASRDGFGSQTFHSMCDNKGATVTVITTSEGYVFGGYTDKPWISQGSYVASSSAFLFSLVCASSNVPAKLPLNGARNGQAIYCNSGYGPTFGGHDIYIPNAANSNGSSTSFGNTYTVPPGMNGQTYFVGTTSFTVREVEVYLVMTHTQ